MYMYWASKFKKNLRKIVEFRVNRDGKRRRKNPGKEQVAGPRVPQISLNCFRRAEWSQTIMPQKLFLRPKLNTHPCRGLVFQQ